MVGWWAEGLNFQCRGPGARWGGGVGELCVCGPRVTSGARARCGMACSGVACLQPLSVLWGSRGNGGTVGTLAADVEGAQWLALRRKGLMYWGGGRRGGKPRCVTRVHQTTKRRDPEEFLYGDRNVSPPFFSDKDEGI